MHGLEMPGRGEIGGFDGNIKVVRVSSSSWVGHRGRIVSLFGSDGQFYTYEVSDTEDYVSTAQVCVFILKLFICTTA